MLCPDSLLSAPHFRLADFALDSFSLRVDPEDRALSTDVKGLLHRLIVDLRAPVIFRNGTVDGRKPTDLRGGGLFGRVNDALVLTKPGQSLRSVWQLPTWFYPAAKQTPLSYHDDKSRWRRNEHGTKLTTVGRGQEFVLDCAHYPEAIAWAAGLIEKYGLTSDT